MPPFSPDYSGAAAVLFDLQAVTVLHDASGCTGNYTLYDEPRWYGSRASVFCSGLRSIDAILGDDEKLERRMMQAAEEIRPELLALVASPVPMVIGTDVEGIAAELEAQTGIPSIGIDTNGTEYYDKGAFKAARLLIERFTGREEVIPGRINILGALSMDYTREEMDSLKGLLEGAGWKVQIVFPDGYNLQQIRDIPKAEVNLAVSRFGFLLARLLEKKYSTPYLCAVPLGSGESGKVLQELERIRTGGGSVIRKGTEKEEQQRNGTESGTTAAKGKTGIRHILVVGEQVYANGIRNMLREADPACRVTVGCLFGKEESLSAEGDLHLWTEKDMRAACNDPVYTGIVGDPFLKMILREGRKDIPFLEIPQYAVSSKFTGMRPNLMGGGGDAFLSAL